MRATRSSAAIVSLEDSGDPALFATIPQTAIPIWPLLRWPLASAMSMRELGFGTNPSTLSRWQLARRAVAGAWGSRHTSTRLRGRAEVLFVVGGTTTTPRPGGGRDNWLVQAFAESQAPRALVLQDVPIPGRAEDRPTFRPTASFDDAIRRTDLAVKLVPSTRRSRAAVDEAARAIIAALDADLDPAAAELAVRVLQVRCARARHLEAAFSRVLDTLEPRLIVMQTAFYGDRSPLIAHARERGIVVAEPQHGWIGPAHAAYNHGAAAADPRLAGSLPDALLTFGEFWSAGVHGPFETVAVGKPQLAAVRDGSRPLAERATTVTIASAAIDPAEAVRFTLAVRDALPTGWSVSFRPHPVERHLVGRRYGELAAADRVEIDLDTDLFAALGRTRAVIGDASTVLYEALAMGCHVLPRDSPFTESYIDRSLFPVVLGDGDDLRSALAVVTEGSPLSARALDRIWAPDPVDRFRRYVDGVLG